MDVQATLQQLKTNKSLSDEALANLTVWLTREDLASFRPEIMAMIEQKEYQKLEDAFYTRIRVGTGGLRGPIGVGSNRINRRTIAEAAQGLAKFIEDFGEEAKAKGVVVGHEARRNSREFAEMCCEVFAANGIKSYIFDSLRSTPEISFAVRHLGSIAGVQITASHNPRTDNGFKFYWTDGGQVVPPLDAKFMDLVTQVTDIKYENFDNAVKTGKIAMIGKEVDEAYIAAVRSLSLSDARSATVVFSPIHGAGITNVLPVLTQEGYHVETVPEQATPDENFPTAAGDVINPEYLEVMQRPIALAEKLGYDLALNSDPDADRIGVAAKRELADTTLQFFTGNQVGIALTAYILEKMKDQNRLTAEHAVITTYVTTSMIGDIARSYGVTAIDDLLVGFKYIAEIIEKMPDSKKFVFAAEESLGYLAGDFVRDKDASIAALLITELVSELKNRGITLVGYLDELFAKYGYYANKLETMELPGKTGFLNIERIMVGFRQNPPKQLGGFNVKIVLDRLPEEKQKRENYKVGATGDQLTFILSDDQRSRVTVRPSGTEPKVKMYIQHFGLVSDNLKEVQAVIDSETQKILDETLKYAKQFIA